jgi:hypothetical protein
MTVAAWPYASRLIIRRFTMLFPGATLIMGFCLAIIMLGCAMAFAAVFASIVQYILNELGDHSQKVQLLRTGARGTFPWWAEPHKTFPLAFWGFVIIMIYALAGPYISIMSHLSKL